MKKILCALLASLMVLSFAGCKIESTADAAIDKPAVVSPTEESTTEDEPVVEDEPVEEEPVEEVEFNAGEINGNVYTNEYADITFNAPEGWTYASDEEIADLMGVSLDLITDNELAQKLTELSTVYGMMAASPDQLNNVQVVFENTVITGNKMTAEGYLKILSAQLENIYAEYNATCEVGEIETVKIGDQEYLYIDIAVDMNGIVLEQGYACRKLDNYLVSIVITAYDEGGAKTILGYFE